MRIALAIIISLLTVYQPALAVIGVAADEDIRPVLYDDGNEQSAAALPDTDGTILLEAPRGQLLYENHCTSCHESLAYIRAKRKAKNYKEVAGWVSQRADLLSLDWSDVEKQDVLQYLNDRYYKYPLTE